MPAELGKRQSAGPGTTLGAPLFTRVRNPGQNREYIDEVFLANNRQRWEKRYEFDAATLEAPLAASTQGTPTGGGLVANAAGGLWQFGFAATAEAEINGFDYGDSLLIDSQKAPFFECMIRISGVAAVTRYVFGLGSAHNNALDSITRNLWFRVEGNNLSLLTESDDNTTDRDDQDTTMDLVANEWTVLRIDGRDLFGVKFYLNDRQVASMNAGAMTGNLQPILLVQKDSGAGQQSFQIDYLRLSGNR